MILANELRVGNWVEWRTEGDKFKRLKIAALDILNASRDHIEFNFRYRPIPLTEQVLLDCGFMKQEDPINCNRNYTTKELLAIDVFIQEHIDINQFVLYLGGNGYVIMNNLHCLQNAVHSLAGTELEYKPKKNDKEEAAESSE